MSSELPDPKPSKPPPSPKRIAALLIYVFILTVLAKLYWPTRETPPSTVAPITNPASGQVPNN